jgi:hypothetical protein
MDIRTLTSFFMWCTILNAGIYVYMATVCVLAPDFIYRMQARWFPISREAWDVSIYAFLGLYKVVFVVFNLVPWVALLIVG